MREITTHKTNECNSQITILAIDGPGNGGADHAYSICVPGGDPGDVRINFQNGPIKEAGVNGLTHEVLIAIVIDRLQSFQKGEFACRENALALTKLDESAHWLNHRTQQRLARGVEGTHAK